jgi:hypothetical protein
MNAIDWNKLTDTEIKRHEDRLRRALARDGLSLRKSRARGSYDPNFNGYMIVDGGRIVAGAGHCAYSLDIGDVYTFVHADAAGGTTGSAADA